MLQQFFRKKTAESKDGDKPSKALIISFQLIKCVRVSRLKLGEVVRGPLRINRGVDQILDSLSQWLKT
jgi:hypothetical protein